MEADQVQPVWLSLQSGPEGIFVLCAQPLLGPGAAELEEAWGLLREKRRLIDVRMEMGRAGAGSPLLPWMSLSSLLLPPLPLSLIHI